MTDLRLKTTSQLLDELWDAVIPAWLGGSTGACMIIGALFWRFEMAPWRILIAYSDGETVWHRYGIDGLYTGPEPPPIPMESNIIPAGIAILGAIIILLTTSRWRRASKELTLRRRRNA